MSTIHALHDINVTNKAHEVSINIIYIYVTANLKYELKIFSRYSMMFILIFNHLFLLKL